MVLIQLQIFLLIITFIYKCKFFSFFFAKNHHRANKFGWPNTYVFTKALGEMMLGHLKGSMPLAILRPTIITSTYKEPFPGWIEGIR